MTITPPITFKSPPEEGLVSVVLPTYNRAKLLPEALDSVFAQTYPSFEVLVADDGSTDETAEVVASYGERVQFLSAETNGGPAAARNRALAVARGEFIAFIDSDDYWRPEKLERQVTYLRDHPECALVASGLHYFRDHQDGRHVESVYIAPPAEPDLRHMVERNFLSTQTVVMRRSVLDVLAPFQEELPVRSDYEFFLRVVMHFPVAYLAEDLTGYRYHDDNLNGNRPALQAEHGVRIFRRLMEVYPDFLERVGLSEAELLEQTYFTCGRTAAHFGEHFTAVNLYAKAYAERPKPRTLAVLAMAFWRGLLGKPGKGGHR